VLGSTVYDGKPLTRVRYKLVHLAYHIGTSGYHTVDKNSLCVFPQFGTCFRPILALSYHSIRRSFMSHLSH